MQNIFEARRQDVDRSEQEHLHLSCARQDQAVFLAFVRQSYSSSAVWRSTGSTGRLPGSSQLQLQGTGTAEAVGSSGFPLNGAALLLQVAAAKNRLLQVAIALQNFQGVGSHMLEYEDGSAEAPAGISLEAAFLLSCSGALSMKALQIIAERGTGVLLPTLPLTKEGSTSSERKQKHRLLPDAAGGDLSAGSHTGGRSARKAVVQEETKDVPLPVPLPAQQLSHHVCPSCSHSCSHSSSSPCSSWGSQHWSEPVLEEWQQRLATAASSAHSRVYVTGQNTYKELGLGGALGRQSFVSRPTLVTSLLGQHVTSIAAGNEHTVVCTASGKALSVGYNGERGRGERWKQREGGREEEEER